MVGTSEGEHEAALAPVERGDGPLPVEPSNREDGVLALRIGIGVAERFEGKAQNAFGADIHACRHCVGQHFELGREAASQPRPHRLAYRRSGSMERWSRTVLQRVAHR